MADPRCTARLLLVLSALAAAGSVRAEDTYRWLDAEGRIHFGAEPPPGARDVRRVGGSGSTINVIPAEPPTGRARSRGPSTAPQPAAPSPAAQALPAAPPGAASEPEPTRIGGRSEYEWRRDAQELAQKIESIEQDIERADDARRNAISMSSTAYYERKIQRLEESLEAARGDLDRLEEQARKLEVPPGWLR